MHDDSYRLSIQADEAVAAISRLEADETVESWSITKITNDQHGLHPRGVGIGVSLMSEYQGKVVHVWAKGRTVTEALSEALKRHHANREVIDGVDPRAVNERQG
jgi:hypothetical protein